MRRHRPTNVFSLSFLDVMACGFGAVVLIYLLINQDIEHEFDTIQQALLAEIRRLDHQVDRSQVQLVELQENLQTTDSRLDDTEQRSSSITETLNLRRLLLAELQRDSQARLEHVNQLAADVEARQREVDRLEAQRAATDGTRVRAFLGDGDRQYLTGLRTGGEYILIAVDTSASMLDETLVNVIRRRNMSEERKLQSPKWQRTIRTVEWLSAQLPLESQFQLYGFNVQAGSLVDGANGRWLEVADANQLDAALTALRRTVPHDGSSLENLFAAIEGLNPRPDNIFLITDSLPTQGAQTPRASTIDGNGRMRLFREALRRMPSEAPINVILLPMEGDPSAAAAYWDLARMTNGTLLAPSRDWP
jgi:hypothetical protein